MTSAIDLKYMARAIELAALATGNTSPNPLVGAVLVHKGKIIGEAYHTRAGEAHAEVAAIDSVREKKLLREATMYVNLEPCTHYGRTPPCANRIIEDKIPRVVIAAADPSEKVGGRGIGKLREAGVEVITGIMEEESRELNKRFFTYHRKKRPYIILKWAQTADGYLDRLRLNDQRGPNWITGPEERMLVHKWRSQEDAILIGDKTACNDDPSLDVRLWGGKSPHRFVLSKDADLPGGLKIFKGSPRVVIFTPAVPKNKARAEYVGVKSREKAIEELLAYMHGHEIQSLIIEGGYDVLSQFIDAGLWDEARVFTGDLVFNAGLKAPVIEGEHEASGNFSHSRLEYIKPRIS